MPVVPIKATGSKESRVEGITGTLEARRVYLPNEAAWLIDFERELRSDGRRDDMLDALTMALTPLQQRTDSWNNTRQQQHRRINDAKAEDEADRIRLAHARAMEQDKRDREETALALKRPHRLSDFAPRFTL